MLPVRLLGPDDAAVLQSVAPDVFDGPVVPRWAAECLTDARHHLAVALDGGVVVGMASAVHYVHPDKAPALWINEVGVAPSHQRQGLARRLLGVLFAHGRALGCTEAWVGNAAARALYASAGGREDAEPFVMATFPLAP